MPLPPASQRAPAATEGAWEGVGGVGRPGEPGRAKRDGRNAAGERQSDAVQQPGGAAVPQPPADVRPEESGRHGGLWKPEIPA
eukprot:scaffold895_cov315-Pinguiococcus_pyrenoidosus.AAC.13